MRYMQAADPQWCCLHGHCLLLREQRVQRTDESCRCLLQEMVLDTALELAGGMHHLHDRSVVHGDLSESCTAQHGTAQHGPCLAPDAGLSGLAICISPYLLSVGRAALTACRVREQRVVGWRNVPMDHSQNAASVRHIMRCALALHVCGSVRHPCRPQQRAAQARRRQEVRSGVQDCR